MCNMRVCERVGQRSVVCYRYIKILEHESHSLYLFFVVHVFIRKCP